MRHVGGHDDALIVPRCGIDAGQIDRFAQIAEPRDQSFERRAGFGLGLVPDRRAHEGKLRRQRRLLGHDVEKYRRRDSARIGIVGIVASEHFENQRGVGERARKYADMIERARQRQDAVRAK